MKKFTSSVGRQRFSFLMLIPLSLFGCDGSMALSDSGASPGSDSGPRSDSSSPRSDGGRPGSDAGGGRPDVPVVVGPPTHAMDGWCADGDWAVCLDFDGYAEGASRLITSEDTAALEIVPWSYDLGNLWRHDTPIYVLDCKSGYEEGGDCEPKFDNGQVRLNPESASFGLGMIRVERPIELVGADGNAETRHIRFDSSLTVHGRQFAALHLSELPAAAIPDLRLRGGGDGISSSADARRSFTLRFIGGTRYGIKAIHWNPPGGECSPSNSDDCWTSQELYHGVPSYEINPLDPELRDQMHEIDVYISRTHIRVLVDGVEYADVDIADLGFDYAYVSVATAGYNPLKEAGGQPDWRGELTSTLFDNIAFDGRTLERNGLTPVGQEYFGFHARGATECTVGGMYRGLVAPAHDAAWNPVYVPMPEGAGPFTEADIECSHSGPGGGDYRSIHRVTR